MPRGGSSFGSTMRWAVQVSNLRPPACKAGALPAELTAPSRPRVHPPPSMAFAALAPLNARSKRETAEDHHGRAQRVRIFGGECPQRDSNPRYHLERVATWAASRWGRPAQNSRELQF